MKPRSRRRFRDETVAPLLTVVVILALWWGAAWMVGARPGDAFGEPPLGSPDAVSAPATAGPVDAPGGTRSSKGAERSTADPPAADVRDATPASLLEPPPSGEAPMVPVAGVNAASLTSSFDEARGGGSRRHEALDILAPRGTPVLASVPGRIVKLFTSAAGGLTIYQFDRDERYCYYYAHLDAYAPDLTEGQTVTRGQIIGFVGTTGNAPPGTPHLHFAVFRLGPEKQWWEGEALDPIDLLR
jgi:murein DD-endopeptidase MepM/ murein hydrolase activator NlpD